MLTAFGKGPGLAGVIGLVVTGLGLATTQFEKFWGAADSEKAKALKEKIKEIKEEIDKLLKTPTKAEGEGAKEIEEAVTEGPAGRVAMSIYRAIQTGKTGLQAVMTPEEQKFMSEEWGPFATEAQQKKRLQIDQRLDRANRGKSGELLNDLRKPGAEGQHARDIVRQMIDLLPPHTFPEGFAGDLEAANPEDIKRQEKLEQQGADNVRRMEAAEKAEKDRIEKQDHANKAQREQHDLLEHARDEDRRRARQAAQVRADVAKASAQGDIHQAKDAIHLARTGGEFVRQEADKARDRLAGKGLNLQHLPTIGPHDTQMEINQTLLSSQQMLAQQQEQARQFLRQAKSLNRKVQTAASSGW
jgi:hypothetical protein